LTGDRAHERGAENRADAPAHLLKHPQELGAGKYALFTYSLSVYFLRRKKEKAGKIGGKEKERERERERRFTPRATHDIEREKR